MRLSVTIPQVLLGLPARNVENPYLASPSGRARLEISYREGCAGLTVSGVAPEVVSKLTGFWSRLASGMGLSGCTSLAVTGGEAAAASSLYAALTVAILHAVARSHSDVLDEYEIVEMGRMSDPWEAPWWQGAIDAMRYCSATGKTVAYRNDEEAVELSEASVTVSRDAAEAVGEGEGAERLGEGVYNAVVHAIGQAVLEASEEIRGGASPSEAGLRMSRVQNGVAHIIYGVRTPGQSCVWVPGLPGILELVCLR